ncbi:aminotransferase class I/II-fold pyridoxal phosphate-dependent enzyme [Streptococcus sp. zg-86]|uniref:Aminotransferase class I/II-fold pyridoxal phosphate-dependent enzyme n=1 Tax=Streptococcus zhangguiae TaxID=2664091 RepID=A0A6I4RRZ0_9STRE|nr:MULTISPECIES: PLP-dependent aminotransferase family protein [unclassified Streptococcus]MTB64980.1 aminotransferase class I/II-fold pyridoxal phosphate-dependent enzyme [Streptococcus sp. zg-86]MTB91194.1 aminotransferase class I/II-fold pyridoxal phosphate-dependent enzyme [Streptococcus sp. zg-36]MWV56935.1 aminotransferase class I/II-fold pyridoxal phosphate-dependent enzyme [Streptococcus sp. zg-70]QTH47173.1 PLP-dependent aminotransferase family protein [Streptococcus sp. zg-86]
MTTKYQTIIQDIITGIEEHRFKRGQKLPSIRKLSEQYQCSKDTVQKAMLELKYQNRIYAVEKSGYYILEDQDFQDTTLSLNPEDFLQLPYDDFRTCVHESLVGREKYLFNYYHQQEGLEELIDSLYQLLMDYHVYCKKDQLVITAGSQQALYILTQMQLSSGKQEILIEEPTYYRMKTLLDEQKLPYQTIERTLNGIDLTQLETIFKSGKIKYFYTIPRLHNPLGTTYTRTIQEAIVQLADQYDVYVIEDDYLADFDAAKTLPLHYLDTHDRVIYIKSFTPTLFPALRLGGIVLPHYLRSRFLQHKSLIDYDTNLIMQKALSLYIDNGMFARNTRHLYQLKQAHEQEMRERLSRYHLTYPHHLTQDILTVQLPKEKISARLKHGLVNTQLITGQSYDYLQLSYNQTFPTDLQQMIEELEKIS